MKTMQEQWADDHGYSEEDRMAFPADLPEPCDFIEFAVGPEVSDTKVIEVLGGGDGLTHFRPHPTRRGWRLVTCNLPEPAEVDAVQWSPFGLMVELDADYLSFEPHDSKLSDPEQDRIHIHNVNSFFFGYQEWLEQLPAKDSSAHSMVI